MADYTEHARALVDGYCWPPALSPETRDLFIAAIATALQQAEEAGTPRWRAVAERMPPDGRIVLCWALTDTETGNWFKETGSYHEGHGLWYVAGRWLDKPYDTLPTHWTPLPGEPR